MISSFPDVVEEVIFFKALQTLPASNSHESSNVLLLKMLTTASIQKTLE